MEEKINEMYENSMLGLIATKKNAPCTAKVLKTILEEDDFKKLSVNDALNVLEDSKTLLIRVLTIR